MFMKLHTLTTHMAINMKLHTLTKFMVIDIYKVVISVVQAPRVSKFDRQTHTYQNLGLHTQLDSGSDKAGSHWATPLLLGLSG